MKMSLLILFLLGSLSVSAQTERGIDCQGHSTTGQSIEARLTSGKLEVSNRFKILIPSTTARAEHIPVINGLTRTDYITSQVRLVVSPKYNDLYGGYLGRLYIRGQQEPIAVTCQIF